MIIKTRDDFSQRTKTLLKDSAGNMCSNPKCKVITSGSKKDAEKTTSIGVAAHITAASINGPRYDSFLSPEKRRGYDNGVWLCQSCSRRIDVDVEAFPITLLTKWRVNAEKYSNKIIGKKLIPHADYEQLLQKFADITGERKTQERLLENLLDQLDSKNASIIDLREQIDNFKAKIQNIKENKSLSADIKELILSGELQSAEDLVDEHYANHVIEAEERLAGVLYERGKVKYLQLKYDDAISALNKAVILQADNDTYANDLALVYFEVGQYELAIQFLKQALELAKQNYGTEHKEVTQICNNLGEAFRANGQFEQAIYYCKKALVLDLKNLGQDHPNVAMERNNLGLAYKGIEKYEDALE